MHYVSVVPVTLQAGDRTLYYCKSLTQGKGNAVVEDRLYTKTFYCILLFIDLHII